jgi:hypothetical protein
VKSLNGVVLLNRFDERTEEQFDELKRFVEPEIAEHIEDRAI